MIINLLTIFPEFFESVLKTSIIKRAQEKALVTINVIDLRTYAHDKRQTTDDRPFGGGPGMVMKVEPIFEALVALETLGTKGKVMLTSASGTLFSQPMAQNLSELDNLTIICGHYQGVDQRVIDHLIDEEVRIGDYVLTGGESAAMVMLDAITRLIPEVLGNESSLQGESHAQAGMGNYPDYTRPEVFNDWPVPDVLLGGNHADIEKWREQNRKKLQ